MVYSPHPDLIEDLISIHDGEILLSPRDNSLDPRDQTELSGRVLVGVHASNGEGEEVAYIASFPSTSHARAFAEGLNGIAHVKSVVKVPPGGLKQLLPKWMSMTAFRYSGGARYTMAEKWMGMKGQEVLASP